MLTPVLLSSHPEYVGAARTLYEESFPESERVPFEALIRSCTMDGRFYVFTEGKEVKAMAAMAVGKTIMSLVYFAVVPEARNHGAGSELLRWVLSKRDGRRLFIDAEDPEPGAPADDIRVRRLGFYQRNGFTSCGFVSEWNGGRYQIWSAGGLITKEEHDAFWEKVKLA